MRRTMIVLMASAAVAAASLHAHDLVPDGAVVAFNRESCPEGWTDFVPAYGRFIRGIDQRGTGIDPEGRRVLASLQDEGFAAHSHGRPRAVYDAGGGPNASWVAHSRYFGYGHENPPSTSDAGGPETRPDNVALLYCEKQRTAPVPGAMKLLTLTTELEDASFCLVWE